MKVKGLLVYVNHLYWKSINRRRKFTKITPAKTTFISSVSPSSLIDRPDWSSWQSKAQGLTEQSERRRGSPWLGNESSPEGIGESGEASLWTWAGGCMQWFRVSPRGHLGSCFLPSWRCFQEEPWSSFPVSKKHAITPTLLFPCAPGAGGGSRLTPEWQTV